MIRQIPNTVNIRINRLFSNKNVFYENDRIYDEALEKNGFKQRLEYVDILRDNFEICNNENSDNSKVNNNNNNNSSSSTVIGETNNWLNNTSDRNNNDSNCRNKKNKHRKRNVIWFNHYIFVNYPLLI